MRWHLRLLVLGIFTALCGMPAFAQGLKGKGSEAATCGDHGTSLHFEKTPKEAAKKALEKEKLVFIVHVSGLFEETDYT